MAKKFFLFIVLIRALAAIVITNAHYTGVYPTDLIANGGLLGDVLFFAVSGFCLASSNESFGKWYLRRFIRVYIPMWVIRIIYIFLGAYIVTGWHDVVDFFIFPRDWHFVSSIIVLYVPLYFVTKYIEINTRNYQKLAGGLLLLQLILYFTIYDYSFYHIDNVREPMIEFLFFQSMLLGLHFRWKSNNSKFVYKTLSNTKIVVGVLVMVGYFISKMLFVKFSSMAPFQIFNQIILLILLYILFDIFMHMEVKLRKINQNNPFWKSVKFVADRTLEIYLVQYVIIANCNVGVFSINWLILTSTILFAAVVLRLMSQLIIKKINI